MQAKRHDSLLWGDSESTNVVAFTNVLFRTRQLINVRAPVPTTWNLAFAVNPQTALPDDAQLLVEIRLGVGRIMNLWKEHFVMVTTPGARRLVGKVLDMPAESLLVTAQLVSLVGVADNDVWTVSAWCAPVIPWKELEVRLAR